MAAAKDVNSLSLLFDRERETRATHVFAERHSGDGRPKIGRLYVTKEALTGLGYPHTVRVTVERGAPEAKQE